MTSCAVKHPASTSVGTNMEGNAVTGNAALDVALHVASCFGWRVWREFPQEDLRRAAWGEER